MFVTEAPVGLCDSAPRSPSDPELGSISLELLEHEICQLASDMTAGMARWLALVGSSTAATGGTTGRGAGAGGVGLLALRSLAAGGARARSRRASRRGASPDPRRVSIRSSELLQGAGADPGCGA